MLIMVCTELLNQRGLAHLPGTRDQQALLGFTVLPIQQLVVCMALEHIPLLFCGE